MNEHHKYRLAYIQEQHIKYKLNHQKEILIKFTSHGTFAKTNTSSTN